jgi:hypothetical protein
MQTQNTELESLVVSQEDVATDTVAKALRGLVSIVKETGEVMPTAEFSHLDVNSRIIAYLLGMRAATILGVGTKVTASAEDIASVIGLEPQRARENLSRLKRKLLLKTADGWQLPVTRIPAACEELTKKRR